MALATLRNFTVAGLLLAACGQALAQNPHTSNGKNCGPWLATAPVSERIRQVESCKSLHVGKAIKLADEYRAGSNGMPRDWAQAARWYRDAIRRASGAPDTTYAARLGEGALHKLISLLQVGGPGLPQDLDAAWRLTTDDHRPNIRQGLWELSLESAFDGRVEPSLSVSDTVCLDAVTVHTSSPFSIWASAMNFASPESGCEVRQLETNRAFSKLQYHCDWRETDGRQYLGNLQVISSGDTAQLTATITFSPGGTVNRKVTKGRRIGDC